MRLYKKGEEGSPWGAIFASVLGLVFLAMFIGIIIALQGDLLTKETAVQTGCWLTNTVKCTGGVFQAMPSLCSLETLEDAVDTPQLADLTRDTWWMFKENSCDMGVSGDEIYPVYSFTPKDDIAIPDFIAYTLTHSRGQSVSGEKSDYAYLETSTEGQSICFDKSNENSAISNLKLEGGELYYILYYDDQVPSEEGDKILITANPNFDAGYWKEVGIATVVAAGAVVVAAATAGAGVAVYTGGISGVSAIVAGSELAIGLIGTKAAVITAAGVAGATGTY
ncbi:hypothetical protein EXS74_02965, partial [Candidatus Woesearchaeota archaeon]|nr:hypothetical protein [Candidatus Woesearchaeota archaeon]